MAERSYDPFSGFTGKKQEGKSSGLGKGLQSVDWDKVKAKGDWVVFDAKKTAMASSKASGNTTTAAGNSNNTAHTLSQEEAEKWRAENTVEVFGKDCPAPMPEFSMLTMLPPFIQKKFEAQGFKKPTAIQSQSWPILFQNRDFVGIAKTGSGKTLAFIVPAIAHIAVQQQLRPGDGPIALVLAPTRELAQQIEVETQRVLPTTMRCACIYGGAPKGPQLQLLREGVHILVATPGRLIDFLTIKRTNLLRCTYLVMDEADRMLDMGFEPQVRDICSQIRPDRQTLMFSATWPKEIQALAATFQKDFIRIHIGSTELLANPDVTQHIMLVPEENKFAELRKLMNANRTRRVLVFCKTKKTTDFLERQLRNIGFDAFAIHGDKEQRQREYILERFRRESHLNVIATDVAARGLDIKELEVVINYDFPMQIDDYVHRIGRTGRAGAKGDAYTFLSKKEEQVTPATVRELINILQKANQTIPTFLTEWAAERKYTVLKRNRDGGPAGRRGPNLHYSHRNTPSFDPSVGHAGKNFLGSSSSGADGGKPFSSSNNNNSSSGVVSAGYTRFADSDDEEPPTKKGRAE